MVAFDERDAAAPARGVYIIIQNATQVSLYVATAYLTGGSWVPGLDPKIGQTIGGSSNVTFENGGDTVYEALGGSIQLSVISGGTIQITWGWPNNSKLLTSCTAQSASVTVNSSTINLNTNFPTLQVNVLPVSASQVLPGLRI